MINLTFEEKLTHQLRILCLGAHSDDIEIGCGGTILKIIENYNISSIKWVVFCSDEKRKKEAEKSAHLFLDKIGNIEITVKNYRDGFLPYLGYEIKDFFEELKTAYNPHLIFTHYRHDLHQDHRLICELTWNTYRNHFILEYEVPKYDGDLGQPNFYVSLNERQLKNKLNYLMESFQSQKSKHWFDNDTFSSIMRIRGLESASPSGYAEAFYSRKIVF